MKKMAAAVVAMVTALALTACAGGFDASKYVNGVLNNIYLGDSTGYMELVEITAEEAKEEYEQGISVEADFFLQYYGLDSVSDDVYQQIVDMYKQIYSKSKFEVKEAVKNGDDYNVEVVVSPIDVIVNSEEAISTAVDDFVANANPDDYTDEQVLNDDLAKLVIKVINDNMANLGYQAEKSIIVKVEKDAQGYYGISDDAIGLLDQDLTALDHTLDQFGDIKTFEYNFIISKLKLIQRQKILDHEIHLGSFIHNHITIKLPAFRIITDAFFQSFCISLD